MAQHRYQYLWQLVCTMCAIWSSISCLFQLVTLLTVFRPQRIRLDCRGFGFWGVAVSWSFKKDIQHTSRTTLLSVLCIWETIWFLSLTYQGGQAVRAVLSWSQSLCREGGRQGSLVQEDPWERLYSWYSRRSALKRASLRERVYWQWGRLETGGLTERGGPFL